MRIGFHNRDGQGRVAIVDAQAALRREAGRILAAAGLRVTDYAHVDGLFDGDDAADSNCLVLGVRTPLPAGLEAMDRVRQRHAYCPPVIVLAEQVDVDSAVAAIQSGIADCLVKPPEPRRLLAAVQRALKLDKCQRQAAAERLRLQALANALSDRERHVLELLLGGLTNKAVAGRLNLSGKTVATHRAHILSKLGVTSLVELARRWPG